MIYSLGADIAKDEFEVCLHSYRLSGLAADMAIPLGKFNGP